MRLLDAAKIPYVSVEYEYDEKDLSGLHAAAFLQIPPEQFFKTLVLRSSKKGYFVCCIPVNKELDLKKAAAALGDKSAEMIHVKELPSVTGYIRGGCSPIGMKKQLKTVLHTRAWNYDTICVSAGKIGSQIELSADTLSRVIPLTKADVADAPSSEKDTSTPT